MLACLWRWKKARAVGAQGKRDQARQGRYAGTRAGGAWRPRQGFIVLPKCNWKALIQSFRQGRDESTFLFQKDPSAVPS